MIEQYKILVVLLERTLKVVASHKLLAIPTNLASSSVGCGGNGLFED
jgi:hypothetical protein